MPDTKVVESFQQRTNGVTEQLLCNWGCMCWLKPLSWGNNHRGVWSTSRRTDEHCFLTRKEGRKHHAVGRVHACHHGGGRTEGFHCYRQVSTHGTYINRSFGFTPHTTVLLSSASWRMELWSYCFPTTFLSSLKVTRGQADVVCQSIVVFSTNLSCPPITHSYKDTFDFAHQVIIGTKK